MGNNIVIYSICSFGMFYITAGLTDCCNDVTIGTVIRVECVGCRLQTVPEDLPINVSVLNLHNNNLTVLYKDSFKYLHQLSQLILSSNGLRMVSSYAFDGLINLEYLDLSNNHLENSSFSVLAFQPFIRLTYLDLSRNMFHLTTSYPESAIRYLQQVVTLKIDIFEGFHFGIGFSNLTNLKQIHLNNITHQRISLLNSTFLGLNQTVISHVTLQFSIKKFEINTLSPFRHLTSLYFDSRRTMGIKDVLTTTLYGLQKRKMEYLALTGNFLTSTGSVFLAKSDFLYLRTICVRNLDLTRNTIKGIAIGALQSWSSNRKCLEVLDISLNNIDSYQLLTLIVLFPSITHVYGSNQIFRNYRKRSAAIRNKLTIFFPSSLIYLNISRVPLSRSLVNITIHESNNLKVVDVSYSLRHMSCSYGRIKGLVNLKELYISGLECSKPNWEMFSDMPYISTLEARQCNLGHVFGKDNILLFKGKYNLTLLDLSANNIYSLNQTVLSDQKHSLQTLILSSNKLTSLQTHILMELRSLEFLDLSHNLISKLTKSDTTFLDVYQKKSPSFKVNLFGNPLACSCEVLEFISWVSTTQMLYNKDELSCSIPDGSQITVMEFLQTFDEFQEKCATQFWLVTSLIMSIVLFIAVILSRVLWRHSVKLRVWCRQPLENEVFLFDVFISYCLDDSKWVARTLVPWLEQENIEYCIDDKDFDAGEDTCDNIMNAIDNSRKSVFVVSCNYFKNEWQTFAMKLTSVYAFRDGRENMNIIILLDDLGRSEFPKLIRKNWDEISPIIWPDEHICGKNKLTKGRKKFWEMLLKQIKKGLAHISDKSYSESTV